MKITATTVITWFLLNACKQANKRISHSHMNRKQKTGMHASLITLPKLQKVLWIGASAVISNQGSQVMWRIAVATAAFGPVASKICFCKWSIIVLSTFSTLTSDSPSAKSRTKRISPSLPWTNRSLFQNRRRIPSKGSTWVSCSKHTYQLPILDTPMQWTPGFQEEMELNWTLNFIQKRCWQQLHWLTVQIRGKLCDDQQQRHQASPS